MPVDSRAVFLEAVMAGADRFAPRGLEYLYFLVLALSRKGAGAAGYRNIKPAELCRAFRDRAAADFGRMAPHVLTRWGLDSGGAVGRAVALLAEKKCFDVKDGEAWEDYEAAGDFRFP